MPANPDLLKKLTTMFLVEAREHGQTLGAGLVELDHTTAPEARQKLVETLFRAVHSLKGAARTVYAVEIEQLCQNMEGVFSDLKSGQRALTAEVIETLHRDATKLGRLIGAMESSSAGESAAPPAAAVPPVRQPVVAPPPEPPRPAPPKVRPEETVRVATSKLDAILVQAEEMLGIKLTQDERTVQVQALATLVAERERHWTEAQPWLQQWRQQTGGGADGRAGELPVRLFALLNEDRAQAEMIGSQMTELARNLMADRRRLESVTDRLLEDVKKALIMPASTLLAGFPKMVHDLAQDSGKQVRFTLRGDEIEIDKRILEQIKDPLVHLVRNSIDHGIGPPAQRESRGKPAQGTLALAITQAAGKVEIQVADDGEGIDVRAVKAAAIKSGLISVAEAAALSAEAARQLVFHSGVSTNRQVTAISGRGLGLAIVQENVIRLGGQVTVESVAGMGTAIRLILPLTLATLRGTLVKVGPRDFVIPTVNVARVVCLPRTAVRRVENRDSVCLGGVTLALVRLAEVLGLAPSPNRGEGAPTLTILILSSGQSSMAFTVDQVLNEQDVLAKPLGPLLPRVRNLSGATISGAGRAIPILHVSDLLQTAIGCSSTAVPGAAGGSVRAKRLLVVDDSITARTALQSILESAGYDVTTAPDGAAALYLLQTGSFDLLVSDVEMPRLDGFGLTMRVRSDPRLAELPVVLVTAREAKEDHERGLEAGANAYLVKSGVDETNLLETLKDLL